MKTALSIIACTLVLILGGSVMARGTYDGGYNPYAAASNVTDFGSLANYLWGFAPIDGRGRILFLDTFNNGLGSWSPTNGGTGSALPVLVTTFVYSPPNAVALQCGTLGPVGGGGFSQIDRSFPIGGQTRVGAEAAIFMGSSAPGLNQPFPGAMDIVMREFDAAGTTGIFATARVDRASNSIMIWKGSLFSGNSWVSVYSLPSTLIDGTAVTYLQIKVVADFSVAHPPANGQYVRLIVGQQTIDISQYQLASINLAGSAGVLDTVIEAQADGVATDNIGRVGYVMLTGDEP